MRYPAGRKEAIINKISPSLSLSISELTKYWGSFYGMQDKILELGFVKFPTLSGLIDIESYAVDILGECGGKTFVESAPAQTKLFDDLGLKSLLAPILFEFAKEQFCYKGNVDNQYHISRFVCPGNSVEKYRSHFDSHLFTLVIPLIIPTSLLGEEVGEFLFMPNARRSPKSEIENIFGKMYFKRYSSRRAMMKLVKARKCEVELFSDQCPLLFLGRTTLHTNKAVSLGASSVRLSSLSHFFDPGPTFVIGRLLRSLRDR
ncbi:hypothetical protein [Halomonas korlensis]|uniref:Phytanoyl-CoA dioxygenase (PhyH) n=1 Tax=Halomonas korlensis TaxID=463301 RepID=A0A1I7F7R7_9GAMM|nr:hypothetical protein [Halomonas korlensis]SFU32241.1 hypothetical protein SAMN04487955_101293 [Halomonas korlensis]